MSAEGKYPSDMADQFQVRMAKGMREEIRKAAAKNKRSMNAEVLARLSSREPVSLRDQFAIEALGGMLAHSTRYRPRDPLENWHKAISDEAYEIADAMLAARDGGSDAQR